jgi:ADP-ribosylation factor related protein 1
MFSLAYGLYEYLFSKEEVKILLVGLSRAGKTSFLESLKALLVPGYCRVPVGATIGMNLARLPWRDVAVVTLWDVGGTMRGIWDAYLGEADGLIFVVDGSERGLFGDSATALGLLLNRLDTHASRMPVAVVVNRVEGRSGCARTEEVVEHVCRPAGLTGVGGPGGRLREYRVFEVNAATGEGVREAGDWIIAASRKKA